MDMRYGFLSGSGGFSGGFLCGFLFTICSVVGVAVFGGVIISSCFVFLFCEVVSDVDC